MLLDYAKEAANFSTNHQLPVLEYAINHYRQPDVAMFDFTSMFAAVNASRAVKRNGHTLLSCLVGDSLLEVVLQQAFFIYMYEVKVCCITFSNKIETFPKLI